MWDIKFYMEVLIRVADKNRFANGVSERVELVSRGPAVFWVPVGSRVGTRVLMWMFRFKPWLQVKNALMFEGTGGSVVWGWSLSCYCGAHGIKTTRRWASGQGTWWAKKSGRGSEGKSMSRVSHLSLLGRWNKRIRGKHFPTEPQTLIRVNFFLFKLYPE